MDRSAALRRLNEWLRLRVRDSLFPMAQTLADKHRLPLRCLLVKSQRTRWASCSAQKNVALNTKILFLPPDMVRYVLAHELCHLRVMNHSRRFWLLVQAVCPDYRSLDTGLRDAWKMVPSWLGSIKTSGRAPWETGRNEMEASAQQLYVAEGVARRR